MALLRDLPPDELTPSRLWTELDAETRQAAAQSLYRGEWDDPAGRREADTAIAAAIHFREVAVRKLPADKRIGYLLRAVRPSDSLASSLLLALHLDRRRPILESFLDALGIPQEEGMIDPDYDLEPPGRDQLSAAVEVLRQSYPDDEIEVYLASLVAMEPETWSGLAGLSVGGTDD